MQNIFTSGVIDLTVTTPQLLATIASDCVIPMIVLFANSYNNVQGNIRISIGTNGTYDNWLPPTDIEDFYAGSFKTLPMNGARIAFGGQDALYLKVHTPPATGDFGVTAFGEGFTI